MSEEGKNMAEYKHAIVSFIDLLGFSDTVKNSISPDEIITMLSIVKDRAKISTESKDMFGSEVMCVSDCIIRAEPLMHPQKVSAPESLMELLSLVHLQAELIHEGFPVRGAITHGRVYFKGRTLFGDAYQEAYKLEQKADVPRIIIDKKLVDDYVGYPEGGGDPEYANGLEELMRLISKDTDGQWFLDYLRAFESETGHESDYVQFVANHRDFIIRGLRNHDGTSVVRKYEWMRQYHNSHVRTFNKGTLANLGSSLKSLLVPHKLT